MLKIGMREGKSSGEKERERGGEGGRTGHHKNTSNNSLSKYFHQKHNIETKEQQEWLERRKNM